MSHKQLNLFEPGSVLSLGDHYFISNRKVYASTGTYDICIGKLDPNSICWFKRYTNEEEILDNATSIVYLGEMLFGLKKLVIITDEFEKLTNDQKEEILLTYFNKVC